MKQKHRRVPTCVQDGGKSAGDRNWVEVCVIACLKGTQTNESTCTLAVEKVVTHERREEDGTKFKE